MITMLAIIATSAFFHGAVFALPQESPQSSPPSSSSSSSYNTPIPIVSQTQETGVDGSYNFSFETGNGIHVEESNYAKKLPAAESRHGSERLIAEEDVQVKTGSYSYTAPDGTVISLSYVADENGFQPKGDHLPQVPEYVERLLGTLPEDSRNQQADVVHRPNEVANVQNQQEPAAAV